MRLASRRPFALALRVVVRLAGLAAILWTALSAFGGKALLWSFDPMVESSFTSMAMLTGTFRLRDGLQHLTGDEQVYDGAVYTNWGFGVPLLEMPFHAVAYRLRSTFPSRFFPDRAIYFLYFAAMVPLLWAAFDRTLRLRGTATRTRPALSWAAALAAVTCALFPLMSCRWAVYEETIAYFVVFQLLAVATYLYTLPSWRAAWVVALGCCAGMALLVRPTGLGYAALWGFIVLTGSPPGRKRRSVALFVAALLPFVGFWMATNVVRSGAPLSMGYENSTPGMTYHTPMLRFGSVCSDTAAHLWDASGRLFRALFVRMPTESSEWLHACHFDLEARPPDTETTSHDPILGPVVLVLLLGMLLGHLARRERRLGLYAPYLAFFALFAAFARGGLGFTWRYQGDFWPLVVLACAEYVRVLPIAANRWLGARLAVLLTGTSAWLYATQVTPARATIKVMEPQDAAALWSSFQNYRYEGDEALPSTISCESVPTWPINQGLGWRSGRGWSCEVSNFTNVYLGVPPGSRHTLRFHVDRAGPAPLRVYVNGRYYVTHTEGDTYVVDVDVDRARLVSPIVAVTIEWSRGVDMPGIKLRSVEMG